MPLIQALQQSTGLSSRAEEDRLLDLLRALPDTSPTATAMAAVAQANFDRWGPVESPGSYSSALPPSAGLPAVPTPIPPAPTTGVLNTVVTAFAADAGTASRRTITIPSATSPDGGYSAAPPESALPTVTTPLTPERRQATATATATAVAPSVINELAATPVDTAPSTLMLAENACAVSAVATMLTADPPDTNATPAPEPIIPDAGFLSAALTAFAANPGNAAETTSDTRRTITIPTPPSPDGGVAATAAEPTPPPVAPPLTPDRSQATAVSPAPAEPNAEPVEATATLPPPERSADELTSISTAWARYHDADPYRLFQMMAEFGWSAQDLSQASGLGLQDVSDYLTRIGAPVGFGGAVTVSGQSLLQPLRDALQAAYLNRPPSGTSANGQPLPPGWCEEITPGGEGEWCIDKHFDLGVFITHYLAGATPEVQDFLRIYGAVQSTSQTSITFASGLTVTQAPNADQTGGWTSPSVNWNTDARIGCYETYAHSNALEQAALRNLVDTPQTQQLIEAFGSANLSLPKTAMAERMRALYGSDLATLMYRQSRAIDEMHRQYVAELNAALAQQPPSDQINAAAPAWWKPGDIQYSDDYTHTPISQTYLFDPAAYQAWYAEQPSVQHQLIAQAYGLGAQAENLSANSPPPSDNEPITAFRTTGTLDSLQLSLGHDNLGHLMATDIGLTTCEGLTRVNLEDPPHLYDDSQVAFMPLRGFVTTNSNVKADVTFLDEALPICVMAGFAYCASILGPQMSAGMGLTTTTAAGAVALTGIGIATSAAVTGAVTSVVGGLINANLSLKGIVQGALSGALTAGLMDLARPLAQTSLLGTLATQTTIQGGVQALMGGDFEDGALAGFASGLSSALSADINANIEQSFEMGLMTGPEVDAARYMASMLAAAVKIVACGTDDPGYALASAFLNETFGLMDGASQPSTDDPVDPPELANTPTPPTNGDWMNVGNDEPELPADPPAANPPPAAEPPAMAQPAPPPIEAAPETPVIPSIPDLPDSGPITDGSAATIDLAADRLAAVETANAFLHSDAFSNRSMEEDPQQQRLVVQAHDTLLKLAANRATDFANAAEINDLKNQFIAANPQLIDPNQLQVGQVLNVPTPDTPIDNAALARANAADASYQASLAAPRAEALAPLDAISSDLDWTISTGAVTTSPEEPQPLAGGTPAKNPSFSDYTAFAGGLVRNSLVSVGAGLAGLGKLLITGNVNASVDVIQNIQQSYGWQPSSAAQQSITTAVQNFAPIQYFNNFKQSAGNYVEPYGPEAATLAYMAPDAALALVLPAATQLAKGSVGAIADMAGMTRAAGSWDSVVLEEVPSSALLGMPVDDNVAALISSKPVGNAGGLTNVGGIVETNPWVDAETATLRCIAANNRTGTPWADLRAAYQQASGQIDFAHIEADVSLNPNGTYSAKGGHFSTSPMVNIVPGMETVGTNGSMRAQVNLLGPDGNFYLKSNGGGYSSLTPDTWSLAQAKGEMSQAFLSRAQLPSGGWFGSSSGVDFRFFPPTANVPLWRGYPIFTP